MIPEAACDVFVDFLVRLNDETIESDEEGFSDPRHLEFLRLLCDRAVARLTDQGPETFVPADETEPVPLKGLKRTGIYEAVFKDVGDRVSRLSG